MTSQNIGATFVFEDIKIEYVQGCFINSRIGPNNKVLLINEFEVLTEPIEKEISVERQVRLKRSHTFQLPDSFDSHSIVGHVTCIGCVQNIYVFQYVTGEKQAKYVKFLVGDSISSTLVMFEDSHHFFHRDSAAIAPLECLLSPDMKICLLRLPQSILSPKKWSKLLICKKTVESEAISVSNGITGTTPSRFRDRRFQLASFDPRKSCSLVTMMLDDYCSKCKISVHDFESNKEILQCTRKLDSSVSTESSDSDSDEELVYFFLQDCALSCNRSGNVYTVTCLLKDNVGKSYCKIIFLEGETFKLIKSNVTFEIFHLKKTESLVPVISACDSYILVCLMEKNMEKCQELFRSRIPKPISLKDLCRSVIIRAIKLSRFSLKNLPVPNSLIQYLQFK